MNHTELLYLSFISQIFIISILIPVWVKKRISNRLESHPPDEYPKLYPISNQSIQFTLKTFKLLNWGVVLFGLFILAATIISGSDELLNWDTQSMLTMYFMIQMMPFINLGFSGFKYQQMMRQVSQPSLRTALLQPRGIPDFVPKLFLIATLLTLLFYIGTVIYVQENPFPGFVGYWNIVFVILTNAFYYFMIHRIIGGKKNDPHQSHEDRMIHTRLIVKLLALAAIMSNLFLTINLFLSVLELRHIGDIVQSLYFQFIALMMSQLSTYQPNNYEVYKEHPSPG